MALSGTYRDPTRKQRNLVKDDNYVGGMYYTNNPLIPGQCKVLVNYDQKERGAVLQPRDGFQQKAEILLKSSAMDFYIHSTGYTICKDLDIDDTFYAQYVLAGPLEADGIKFRDSIVVIEAASGDLHTVTIDPTYIENPKLRIVDTQDLHTVHNMPVDNIDPTGIKAVIDNVVYFFCKDTTLEYIGYLEISKTGTAYTMKMVRNTNTEITPKEAVNYGYNMLDDDPYNFAILTNAVGKVQLEGVLPYDTNDVLKFDARVNEDIVFKLIYTYPEGALETYKVQWEAQNLESDTEAIILQRREDSPTYGPGDPISIETTPPYKQFSIIVKLYYDDEVTPAAAIVLPAYTLANSGKSGVMNLAPVNYSIPSGTGMCTWEKRLVVWGVKGGKYVLFTSEAGNPAYFPYPHNVDTFDEDIMICVPYMDKLMVFTETKLYQMSIDLENGGYKRSVVQEDLNIQSHDILSLHIIKNMIYFKSGSYYYMVVPGGSDQSSQLKLAPMSTNIELMLDDIKSAASEIINQVYRIDYYYDLLGNTPDYYLDDYYTYLDGAHVRNVHRIRIEVPEVSLVKHFDFILNYDSMLRTWSTYINESNGKRIQMYRRRATGSSEYINIYNPTYNSPRLQILHRLEKQIADSYPLGFARTFKNYQLIDTGYRSQAPELMKRFREIQFKLNNLEQVKLDFYTQFYVDDAVRKNFFKRESIHITDPVDPNYGLLYISADYQDPRFINQLQDTTFVDDSQLYGATTLNGETEETDVWYLDGSMFPTISVHKVRMKVSGKGYAGRFMLLSMNERAYQLLNVNWVFRQMMAR